MNDHLTFDFAEPAVPPSRTSGIDELVHLPPTIDARFEAFHAANPWVYDELVRLARGLVERGHRRIGIGMLFEVMRWSWYMHTSDPTSEWKLNNDYRSRYARLIMVTEDDLAGCFETRGLRGT